MSTIHQRTAGLCLALALLALPAPAAHADDTVVKATLEPQVIGVGETATFTIEVRGTGLSRLSFRPDFALENLDIVGGPNQYDNIQLSNGTLTRTFRESWQVRPRAVGKARVHSLRVQTQDGVFQMRDREITVQEAPTRPAEEPQSEPEEPDDPFARIFGAPFQRPAPAPRRAAVFLRAEVQPAHPYTGQQALYTVYLYTRDDISSMAAREMPTFRGFWVRDVPQPQHLPTDMVTVDGERYGRVVVVQKALFPLRPGRYAIEPTAMDVVVQVADSRWFGPAFSHPEQVLLRAPALAVDVQPLPPAPPRFAGAVGQMQMSARVEPAQLRVGEAATLTVTLTGRGNVQGVAEPSIPVPAGLKIFPPQQQGEEKVVGTAVQGTRTWSWVIVPEHPGTAAIQVPEIPYFDPQSGQYKAAATPPLQVATLPAAAAVDTGNSMLSSLRAPAGETVRRELPWQRVLPWLLAAVGGFALTVALARRRRPLEAPIEAPVAAPAGVAAASPVPLPEAPPAPAFHAEIARRLREAESESRPRQAAARIEEAWRAFLQQRWGVPSGTPSPRWAELLRARGADPEAAAELVRLADDLHYLRYAPQLSATETLRGDVLAQSRRLLRRLR